MPPSKIINCPLKWEEVIEIVQSNELEKFARSRLLTENYLRFKNKLEEDGTTVFKHLVSTELKWYDPKDNNDLPWDAVVTSKMPDADIVIKPKGNRLFECEEDVCILPNHFPYYFEQDIVHLCVWTKVRIPSDVDSPIGDISTFTREIIEEYIQKTFMKYLDIDRSHLVWFRNWEALQSVKAISHVHVIVKGAPADKVSSLFYTPGILPYID